MRLVNPGTQHTFHRDEVNTLDTCLHGLLLLHEHFPDFFREHAAQRCVTIDLLFGACAAFWKLVEQGGVALCWPRDTYYGEMTHDSPPEELLVDCALYSREIYMELWHFIAEPRPRCYGLGVQGLRDEGNEPADVSLLTIALWQVFVRTPWALGFSDALLKEVVEPAVLEQARRFRPLPVLSIRQFDAFLSDVEAQIAEPEADAYGVKMRDLLGYAFAETSTVLANISQYEADVIHYGEIEGGWTWKGWRELANEQAYARQIERAYLMWSTRLGSDLGALRSLLARLHRLARRVVQSGAHLSGGTLAELLSEAGIISDPEQLNLGPWESEQNDDTD